MSTPKRIGIIELRHVYDGYSIEVLDDGTLRNRWEESRDEFPKRFEATQEWINAQISKEWSAA